MEIFLYHHLVFSYCISK